MSLNYRKNKVAKLSLSRRRVMLRMFCEEQHYFPSLREIRDELVNAQLKNINDRSKKWSNRTRFTSLLESYKAKWNLLFELSELGDLDKPLTPQILSDPFCNITKHILYIYTIESFIYQDMNLAIREKDETKI